MNHLIELRELIYDTVRLNEAHNTPETLEGFEWVKTETIFSEMVLTGANLLNLLKMTPHYWQSPIEIETRLKSIQALTVTLDMKLHLYQKQ